MELDVLRTYKAAVFANASKANRTVKFSRVLAAIDYAPVVTMLLTAAVLSVICIALYVILATKYPVIWEITARCFYTTYEVLWLNEGTRYMNFALLATCVFTGLACGKAGFPLWLFYSSALLMVAYMAGRFLQVLTQNSILEWSLVVTGAVVFIGGFIAGTVALRNSTIPWAVFDFVLGIVGLMVFFVYALQLFFKLTLPLMLCFQETLAHQMGKMRHQIHSVDVGTMTDPEENQITNPGEDQMTAPEENQMTNPKKDRKTNPDELPMTGTKESRKMLMTFPFVDRSKSLACDRHPRMRSQNVLDNEDRNSSQEKEVPYAASVECPASAHAVDGSSSQEPLYYVLDDSSNLESLAEDSLTDEIPEDVMSPKRKFEGNDSESYPDNQKFHHSVKALNLSPRKLLAQESKFHSLSSNFMHREMTPSKEYEMCLLQAAKGNSKSNLESSFLASVTHVNSVQRLPNSKGNIKPCLQTSTLSSTSDHSAQKCSSFSQQNPLPNDVNETPQVADQQPRNIAQECVHPNLLKPYAPLAEETSKLLDTKKDNILPNDTVSSRIPRTQSFDPNQKVDLFINNSKPLPPHPPKDSPSDGNSEKLYIRSKRKSLTLPTPAQDALEDQYSGLVQRFY